MSLEISIERVKMLREWRMWVHRIAEVVKEIIPDAEVYVVGSVVRGDSVGGSDVDILVVSPQIPRKPVDIAKLKTIIEDKLNLPYYHPFEIHMLKPEEARYLMEKSKGYMIRIA